MLKNGRLNRLVQSFFSIEVINTARIAVPRKLSRETL
jgi:hypothetical protein